MISVEIDSKAAQAALLEMDAAVRAVGALTLDAGSPLPYAFGIETGRKRSGALARRKGGALRWPGEATGSAEPPCFASSSSFDTSPSSS